MARQRTKSQNIGSTAGAVLTLLGLASLAGWVGQGVCPFGYVFGIPLRIVLETLPPVFHEAGHALQTCLLRHVGLLAGLFQISISSWQLVLTFLGVS
jgi:hypothetical protein